MTPSSETISYVAIAVIPPLPHKVTLCALSRAMAKLYGSWWVLDQDNFPPHISVWLAYVPTKNLTQIDSALRKATAKQSAFQLTTNGLQISPEGHVGLKIATSEVLTELHTRLLTLLNIQRDGYVHPKYADNPGRYSEEQWKSILQYGTRFAGANFTPHITLSVIPPADIPKVSQTQTGIAVDFAVQELVMFRQAESGKSVEILGTYELLG